MSRLSNRTIILAFAVIAAISLTFGILNFHKALPEIGIDFKVSRAEALQNAREFMASRHYDISGFKEHIQFSYAGTSKIYLERELGVERLTSLAEDSLDIWRWGVRFYKPLQKLEYRVMLDPKGRIVAFRRDIPENLPGPTLDTLAAQTLAEAFIAGPMAQDLANWTLIETGVTDRPARRDYTFTYELNGFKAKEATYRMEALVQGAEVAGFKRFVREPQDWWRGWEKQRSQNELFQTIAEVAAFLIGIALLYYFFKNSKQGQIHWKTAIGLGAVLATVKFIEALNAIPLSLGGYQTTQSYSSFLSMELFSALTGALGNGLVLILMFGAGEWLYRQDYPDKLSFSAFFTRRGMRSREFFQATIMGYLLCAFDIGLVVAIYMLGSKVGFWSPADIKYDETVSTMLPWIYPLAVSLGASLLEEFMFRLFGISLFKRLTKSTFLAIIIPAFIWGFLHSSYPQQPGFARGLEVGIVGVIIGLAMLRFGIWTTLVYHYLFDSVMIGLFLFRSHDLYFWVSGLIVCGFLLAPAVIAGVIYLRKRRFEDVEDLFNKNVVIETTDKSVQLEQVEPTLESIPQIPAKKSDKKWILAIGVTGILLAFVPGPREFGEDFKLNVPQKEALKIARQAAEATYSVNLDDYKVGFWPIGAKGATGLVSGGGKDYVMSYLKRYGTLDDAEKVMLNPNGPYRETWGIRFQREYDPTEYNCTVTMDAGRVTSFIQIADSLAGSDLSADSARLLATNTFETGDPEASKFHLIEEKSTKRPNRRDWFYIWESNDPVVKDAHIRRNVTIKGNIATLGNRFVKVPEEWERAEKEQQLGLTLILIMVSIAFMALSVWIIISFTKVVKKGEVVWKEGIVPAVIVLIATLIGALNKCPTFWTDYENSKPVTNFLFEEVLKNIVTALSSAGIAFVLVVLAQGLASGAVGRRISLLWGDATKDSRREDLMAALGATGVILGVGWTMKALTGWLGMPTHSWGSVLPDEIITSYPVVAGLTDSIDKLFQGAAMIMVVFMLVNQWARAWYRQVILLLIVGLAGMAGESVNGGNLTNGEMIWAFTHMTILVVAAFYAFRAWIGFRLRAAAVTLVLIGLIKLGGALLSLGATEYAWQGGALIAVAIALVVSMYLKPGEQG